MLTLKDKLNTKALLLYFPWIAHNFHQKHQSLDFIENWNIIQFFRVQVYSASFHLVMSNGRIKSSVK